MNMLRFKATLREINAFGACESGVTRLAYTKAHWDAVRHFMQLCEREGMDVRMDACGNIVARREGLFRELPAVACGSHLDTVVRGGRFDGTVGVVAGLEIVRELNEQNIRTKHPIELIVFACEESSRFHVSTIGSKAMTGKLDHMRTARLMDNEGRSFGEALTAVGLDPERLPSARRSLHELKAFFELHIEQGPLLEQSGADIGLVTGIASALRMEVTVTGCAAHSGTTPMRARQDALAGAAELVLELERAALAEEETGTVATCGICTVSPGSMNVIPGQVVLKLEIRGSDQLSKKRVAARIADAADALSERRSLRIATMLLSDDKPVELDDKLVRLLGGLCDKQRLAWTTMTSGAGHDAMNMAACWPTGLIFIPSRCGISHHPDEFSTWEHIAQGAGLLREALLQAAEAELAAPCTAWHDKGGDAHAHG